MQCILSPLISINPSGDLPINLLEVQTIILFSFWKTYVGPALAAGFGMGYLEAVGYTLLGASVSVFCSLYFQRQLTQGFKHLMGYWPGRSPKRPPGFNPRLRKTLIFYRRYGFWGLMLLTPILLGLPVGTWLALRLGSSRVRVAITVLAMAFLWSTVSYLLALNGLARLGMG